MAICNLFFFADFHFSSKELYLSHKLVPLNDLNFTISHHIPSLDPSPRHCFFVGSCQTCTSLSYRELLLIGCQVGLPLLGVYRFLLGLELSDLSRKLSHYLWLKGWDCQLKFRWGKTFERGLQLDSQRHPVDFLRMFYHL